MNRSTGTGKYELLLERCSHLEAIPTAVAHPCEESALEGAIEAGQKGLISPILVGPAHKIQEIAKVKMADLNAKDVEGAMRMIEGTCRSMGVKVES